jgi:hypothetical protein
MASITTPWYVVPSPSIYSNVNLVGTMHATSAEDVYEGMYIPKSKYPWPPFSSLLNGFVQMRSSSLMFGKCYQISARQRKAEHVTGRWAATRPNTLNLINSYRIGSSLRMAN